MNLPQSTMPDDISPIVKSLPTGEPPKLDLSKYRTGELTQRMVDLVSLQGAVLRVASPALYVAIAAVLTCSLIFYMSEISRLPFLVICGYSLVSGVLIGVLLGIVRIAYSAMRNVESILALILEVVGKIADDYQQFQSGKTQLPSGGELVEQIHEDVVLPIMEESVASELGFLGKPLLWVYRRTIGSSVRYLVKRAKRKEATEIEKRELEKDFDTGVHVVAKYSESIRCYAASASTVVSHAGTRIRFYAMLPLYALFAIALLLALTPIVVVRCFY